MSFAVPEVAGRVGPEHEHGSQQRQGSPGQRPQIKQQHRDHRQSQRRDRDGPRPAPADPGLIPRDGAGPRHQHDDERQHPFQGQRQPLPGIRAHPLDQIRRCRVRAGVHGEPPVPPIDDCDGRGGQAEEHQCHQRAPRPGWFSCALGQGDLLAQHRQRRQRRDLLDSGRDAGLKPWGRTRWRWAPRNGRSWRCGLWRGYRMGGHRPPRLLG